MDAEEFFDKNVDEYDSEIMRLDLDFLKFIKKTRNNNSNLIDIGGGNGNFSRLINQNFPDINITILDPSKKLLDKIDDPKINKVVGKLPDDVHLDSKFDYIHVRNVFHHITGNSIGESKRLVKESLNYLNQILDENGVLLIQESYSEGYLIPTLPRYLIFHLLAIQNRLNIKIPMDEFIMGLNVCFYTRKEFQSILEECGFEVVNNKTVDNWNETRRFMLIKDQGQVSFIVKKKS